MKELSYEERMRMAGVLRGSPPANNADAPAAATSDADSSQRAVQPSLLAPAPVRKTMPTRIKDHFDSGDDNYFLQAVKSMMRGFGDADQPNEV